MLWLADSADAIKDGTLGALVAHKLAILAQEITMFRFSGIELRFLASLLLLAASVATRIVNGSRWASLVDQLAIGTHIEAIFRFCGIKIALFTGL